MYPGLQNESSALVPVDCYFISSYSRESPEVTEISRF